MTDPRFDSLTTVAITGAEQLDDTELARALHNAIDRVIVRQGGASELGQDLRELAAVCLVTARRIETRR